MSDALQTVGDFRRAWDGLPDAAPVEIVLADERRGKVELVATVYGFPCVTAYSYGMLLVGWAPTPAHLRDPLDGLPAARVGV